MSTVRPTVYTNPSQKGNFSKTNLKPEEFENDPFASQIETYKVDLELLSSKQEIPVWYDSQPH